MWTGTGIGLVFGDERGLLSAGFAFIPILEQGLKSLGNPSDVPVLYDPKVSPLGLLEWAKRGTRPASFSQRSFADQRLHAQARSALRR